MLPSYQMPSRSISEPQLKPNSHLAAGRFARMECDEAKHSYTARNSSTPAGIRARGPRGYGWVTTHICAMFISKTATANILALITCVGASHYDITYFSDNACKNQIGSAKNDFTANGCNSAQGTGSIRVNNLQEAHIRVWVSAVDFFSPRSERSNLW